MRFLTEEDSGAWATAHGFAASPAGFPSAAIRQLPHLRIAVPTEPGALLTFCRRLTQELSPRATCLLSIVTWGVWPSSENWHLYYRLRQSYGDYRLLEEAPGHLFLDYEEPELVSFLELALIFGWDADVLPELTYGGPETVRLHVSHDEWVALASKDAGIVAHWREEFAEGGYVILPDRAA
jgi:hypothetical protein